MSLLGHGLDSAEEFLQSGGVVFRYRRHHNWRIGAYKSVAFEWKFAVSARMVITR
jgi:hypothetical protein